MRAQYKHLPTEDMMESGMTFDYSSAFTYNNFNNKKYKSAFTYSKGDVQPYAPNVIQHQTTVSHSLIDRLCFYLINLFAYLFFALTFPITAWFAFKRVSNFERLVVFRWGRLLQTKGPGTVFVMPFVDTFHKVDIRMKAFNVPPQQVITGDGAIIEVGADVYYRIENPEKSITTIQNLDKSTRILVQTSLLNLLVRLPLSKIDGHRNTITENVQKTSNKAAKDWGVEISRIDLPHIKILSKAPERQPKPTFIMPPGFGNLGAVAECFSDNSVPEAFQHLASAFMAAQGRNFQLESDGSRQPELMTPTFVSSDASPAPESFTGNLVAAADRDETVAMTIDEILQIASRALSEPIVRKVNAVYHFQLHGEGGSVYFLNLRHGQGSIGKGVWSGEGEVDASLMMTTLDLQQMLSGKLKPFQAYMSGRLRVSGDLAAALRLETFVDRVVAQAKSR